MTKILIWELIIVVFLLIVLSVGYNTMYSNFSYCMEKQITDIKNVNYSTQIICLNYSSLTSLITIFILTAIWYGILLMLSSTIALIVLTYMLIKKDYIKKEKLANLDEKKNL